MIFWIVFFAFVICGILSIALWIDPDALNNRHWDLIPIFFTPITGILLVAMIVILGMNNIGKEGKIEAYKQRYEALVYQAENNVYENDNDIGKKELFDQIQYWNEDLARKKNLQKNFWVGIFYPDIYDQFDLIPMSIFDEGKQNE